MIMVHIDSNNTLVEPMKNKSDAEMQRAYQVLINRCRHAGFVIHKHILDNEASQAFKRLITDNQISYELVPPGSHRRNIAEVAIKTFKQHSLSILTGVDSSFPMHLWCRLLPQAEMTLNLLKKSNTVPTISAHAHMNGQHDYNKVPLSPLGCAVQCHEKSDKRKSWDPHSIDGYYIGTSHEHYRCHRVYITSTKSERVTDTIFFKHKYLTHPTITPEDAIIRAAEDLKQALRGKLSTRGNQRFEAIEQLRAIFAVTNPKPPAPPLRVRIATLTASPP